jgi:uncharacterized membrane protein
MKTEFNEPKPPTEEISEENSIYPNIKKVQSINHEKDSSKK